MSTAAVIAAAGLSSRMRDFKPLLCLGSSTVIGHTIDALRTAGAAPIVVVTGYQSAVLERHLRYSGVMFQKNERFAQTDMLASLQLDWQPCRRRRTRCSSPRRMCPWCPLTRSNAC